MKPENLWGNNHLENYFRKSLTLTCSPEQAYARIYVDTGYELFINGRYVARVDEWCNARDYNVRLFLRQGENLIAVHALNHGGHRGFAFELVVNGETVAVSDGSWKTAPAEKWGWMLAEYDDSAWEAPAILNMSAAGGPQWWTKPGSDPERIVPALDCSQFFLGDIPKTCASPYWNAEPVCWQPHSSVIELVGGDYAAFATADHLPKVQAYREIMHSSARQESGRVLIESTQRYTGPSFVVDFGGETVGFFRMKLTSEKSMSYRLYYGETLDEALSEPSRDNALNRMLREEYRVFPGMQEVESRMRVAFRYVRVEFYDCEALVNASDFSVRTTLYPVARKGYFACDDADLTKLWQMGERTQHFCMQEYYLDAPKRDRFMWTGDARMQLLINFYTFGDTKLFEFCWDELSRVQFPGGGISSAYGEGCSMLWDYTAWYVIAFYDYYIYTGNTAFALKHYANLTGAVDFLASLTDETGLINVPANPLGKLWMVELNNFVGYDPFLNELYLRALQAAKLFAEMAGDESARARYDAMIAKAAPGVKKLLEGGSMFRYFETTGHSTLQYELAEMELFDGQIEDMLMRIRTYFCGTISSGSDCLHEGPRTGKVARIDEHVTDRPHYGSYCHAWTAAATVLLPMGIAGITPIAPGFDRVRIEPRADYIRRFDCVVPTPHGEIAVVVRDGMLRYHLPEGVEAELVIDGKVTRVVSDGQARLN